MKNKYFIFISTLIVSLFVFAASVRTIDFDIARTTGASNAMHLRTNSTNRISINPSGSVNISGDATVGTSIALTKLTVSGDVSLAEQSGIRFYEQSANGSNYIALKAPTSIGANLTYTWPSADGSSGQILSTNGSGTLAWATASSGGGLTYTLDANASVSFAVNRFYKLTNTSAVGTLPTAAGNSGAIIRAKYSGSGSCTFNTTSGELIDSWSSGDIVIYSGESMSFMSDGSNWLIIDQKLKDGYSTIFTVTGGDITIATNGQLRFNATPVKVNSGVTITQDSTNGISITADRPGTVIITLNSDLYYNTGFTLRLQKNGSVYRAIQASGNSSGNWISVGGTMDRASKNDVYRWLVGGASPGSGLTNYGNVSVTLRPEY